MIVAGGSGGEGDGNWVGGGDVAGRDGGNGEAGIGGGVLGCGRDGLGGGAGYELGSVMGAGGALGGAGRTGYGRGRVVGRTGGCGRGDDYDWGGNGAAFTGRGGALWGRVLVMTEGVTQGAETQDEGEDDDRRDYEDEDLGRLSDITQHPRMDGDGIIL
ncbi:hypothetical protein MLD38_009131 [Melastoma candidum]|nr:hypothetical protein MLD38_009131 [Melastoma candidum]